MAILIIVGGHVVVQIMGLYWRMTGGQEVYDEHFERFNRIESKLDRLLKDKEDDDE